MSVSSHLTPEPERRLWLIWEVMRETAENCDWKIAALTAFAAAELAVFRPTGLALYALVAALPLGVGAFSPLSRALKQLTLQETRRSKPSVDDNMVSVEDVAKYTHGELIHRLDRYLGGGITATQYYEDLVGQILVSARLAHLKRRLLLASCVALAVGQVALVARLLSP